MQDAVIVATARSPIGRANKGSLKDMRPEDLGTQVIEALLQKVPEVRPELVQDLILGCANPQGEQGRNLGRCWRSRWDTTPCPEPP